MTTSHSPNTNIESIDPVEFSEMVAERAYYKAEQRGFVAGHEIEDWLEAEQELRNQCFYWFHEEW